MAFRALSVCLIFAFLCILVTSPVGGGSVNFTVNPAFVHAVSHDGGVTVILVSGDAAFLDESTGQPISKFRLDRIPIIYRTDPNAWHNIPIDRWLASFTKALKSGTPIKINCLGAEMLRDKRDTVQAVYCLVM